MTRPLSATEREILRRLGRGDTTARIADQLGIAESTVSWYVRRVVRDLGPRRTDDLAAELATRHGRRRVSVAALLLAGVSVLAVAAIAFARTQPFDGRPSSSASAPTAGTGTSAPPTPVATSVPNATLPSTNETSAPASPPVPGTPPMLSPLPTVPLPTPPAPAPLATALPLPTASLPNLLPPPPTLPLPTLPLPTAPLATPRIP